MSFSNEVADFMDSVGPFYETIDDNSESINGSNPGDSGIELESGNINALLGNFDEALINGNDVHVKVDFVTPVGDIFVFSFLKRQPNNYIRYVNIAIYEILRMKIE